MGIILGALGGAGKAAGEIADSNTKLWNAQDMAATQAQLDIAKEKAIQAMREEGTIRAEDRGLANRAKERGAIVDETVANAPRMRAVKLEDKKSDYDPEILALQEKAKTGMLTAEEQAKLDFYTKNKPGIIEQKQSLTDAGETTSTKNRNDAYAKYLEGGGRKSADGKALKLDEDDKFDLNTKAAGVKDAEHMLAEAMAKLEGRNPETDEGVKYLKNRVSQARASLSRKEAQLGLITPETLADQALSRSKNGAEVMAEVSKLVPIFGTEMVDQVAKAVYADDRWNALPKPGATAQSPTAGKPNGIVAKAAAPAYVPPADSPAGKFQAAQTARVESAGRDDARKQQQAQQAFDAVGNDVAAAADLQQSPLFAYLSRDQKMQISKLVNGR